MSDFWDESSPFDNRLSSAPPPTHIATPTVIVDRCPLFREGLKEALGESAFTVVASTDDLKEVRLSNALSNAPLLIILVASGSLTDDVAALKSARSQFPNCTTVSLCRDCQPQQAAVLFCAGVGAILLLPSRTDGFIEALELVMLGQHVVPLHLMNCCVSSDEFDADDDLALISPKASDNLGIRLSRLSIREVEIVQCLLAGQTNRSIAQRLMISESTVKVHVKAILRKIKVKNRTQAAIWAVNNVETGNMPAPLNASSYLPAPL